MSLLPQDIVVLLKFVVCKKQNGIHWTRASIANELILSASQVQYAIERLKKVHLLVQSGKDLEPHLNNVQEFLIHALKYFSPSVQGEVTRGIPTLWAAPVLKYHFPSRELAPVWPDAEGKIKGYTFEPIHACAISGAKEDDQLYDLLVLADILRAGKAREINMAKSLLEHYVKGK